jgi:hypothetical protein
MASVMLVVPTIKGKKSTGNPAGRNSFVFLKNIGPRMASGGIA